LEVALSCLQKLQILQKRVIQQKKIENCPLGNGIRHLHHSFKISALSEIMDKAI
jgi:hypothetical protein